ncbi:MAG: NUDIX domain-containing protein [Spirochaetaceae bacterium]|jgi:ADP-ribose pyrophosphatase YjhB (NUDIX family)|nr:NUDIX domain-containing protein [Spirochaetaceae bacterium]
MFRYCPSCASENIFFEGGKKFRCPDCGFVYFHNVAAAAGCIIDTGKALLLLERGKEPALGKLDVPGGFVDAGEGAIEALIRECREEIGWAPAASELRFFASFANRYPYKNIDYNTCDLFFCATGFFMPCLQSEKGGVHLGSDFDVQNLKLQKEEIAAAHLVAYDKIKLDELAFPSTRRAVGAYLRQL